MNIIRGFNPMTDRYEFDFGRCSYAKGFAQLDTGQDASYFGTWINPDEKVIVNYCEGDITKTECETAKELVEEVERIKVWNNEMGHRFLGIDPGLSETMKAKFEAAGLGGYLH
jgi:hypothetical protein